MKKIFSILVIFLILVSGMHFTVATHICGGEVAARKWSFTGKTATCGMESPEESCPMHGGIDSNCCQNKITTFVVDNNYNKSVSQNLEVHEKVKLVFAIPISLFTNTAKLNFTTYFNIKPPDDLIVSNVILSKICVFRI
ncbi:MAG: hypothetical protein KKD74_11030 [Bacteroidetes bacterium]|nr:hypothetical protein [Bacteroidota bacterium]